MQIEGLTKYFLQIQSLIQGFAGVNIFKSPDYKASTMIMPLQYKCQK